jgi:hypothetical protein
MKTMPPPCCVVVTNVALVANQVGNASPACVLTCTHRLVELTKSGCVAIDDDWRILREYMHKLSPSGQPGPGDAFLRWLLTNQANPERCLQVKLTPRSADENDFEEFPSHRGLSAFDPSDRKFVAVAATCPEGPASILQALDSKWWGWAGALAECGIVVDFLCPEEIAAKHREKMGPP